MPTATLKPRKRLQPLATVMTWVFWIAVLSSVTTVMRTLTGQGPLFGAHIGGPSPALRGICLSAAQALLPHTASALGQSGLSLGVRAAWDSASVCAAHPSFGQSLAAAIAVLPVDLFRLGALYLAMRLARVAVRDGVYSDQAARLLAVVGWWLLAGGLVATLAEAFARLNLLGQLVTWPVDWGQWSVAWSVSWPVAWTGLGLIVFARVMRVGVVMRADLEGTV